jgi:leader peptidase (prepilin peptidase)/N-methyltransferase
MACLLAVAAEVAPGLPSRFGQGLPFVITPALHGLFIAFLFILGACIGSFLNVVVWRLPRGESLVTPPSHCPKCGHQLAWYDNVPVLGWLWLRGRCRYCSAPISARYPIVEAVTGLLFVFYYVMFFILHIGPCHMVHDMAGDIIHMSGLHSLPDDWPFYALYMLLISALLAASLIDAELLIIPIEIPWLVAAVALMTHAVIDRPNHAGALNIGPPAAALAAGAGVGLLLSLLAWRRGWIPTSFPQGEPLLEVDRAAMAQEIAEAKRNGQPLDEEPILPPPYTSSQIRAEMSKEMLFLLPPLLLGTLWLLLCTQVEPLRRAWDGLIAYPWISGLLGALLGAMVGGFIVWKFRIFGTLVFGRVAMGLGDVHLMLGVGAVLGAGAVTITFFLAPFFAILLAIYMLLTGTRRELPFGPYLSLAAAFVLLFYCPIAAYLAPGAEGFVIVMHHLFQGVL